MYVTLVLSQNPSKNIRPETGVQQFHLTAIYDESLGTPSFGRIGADRHSNPLTVLLLQFEQNENWKKKQERI